MSETQDNQPGQKPAPDLEELARRLLDLWQDQLTAVAANPDLATQAARLMAAMPLPGMWLSQLGQMGGGPMGQDTDMTKLWAKMAQDWMAQDWSKGAQSAAAGQPATHSAAAPQNGAAPRSAPTAAASGPGGSDLGELGRRLAGIEQRLGELAEQSQPKPKSGPKPARKPRSTPAKPRRSRAADPGSGSGGADGGTAG